MPENKYYVIPSSGRKSIAIDPPEGAKNPVRFYPGDWVVTNGNTVGRYNKGRKEWELMRHDDSHAMKWSDEANKKLDSVGAKERSFNQLSGVVDKLPEPPKDGLGVYLHVHSDKYQPPNKTWDPKTDVYTMKNPPPKVEEKPAPKPSDDSMDEHIKGFRKQRLSPAEITLKLRKLDEKKKWTIGDVEKRLKAIDSKPIPGGDGEKQPKKSKPQPEESGESKADFLKEVGDQMVANPDPANRKLHPRVKVKSLPWEHQKKFYDSWRTKTAHSVVKRFLTLQ